MYRSLVKSSQIKECHDQRQSRVRARTQFKRSSSTSASALDVLRSNVQPSSSPCRHPPTKKATSDMSDTQPAAPTLKKLMKIPDLPNEICDLIGQQVVKLPNYYHAALPAYFPLLFPKHPNPTKSSSYALALSHSRFHPRVTLRLWKHVVIAKDSHIKNILKRPYTQTREAMYLSTVRCDIHLPFSAPTRDMNAFFLGFPNLTTINWEYPPLSFFNQFTTSPCPTVNFLKLGTLPIGFSGNNLVDLDCIFPCLWSLQILDTPVIQLLIPTQFHREPIFKSLTVLAVGTPWNFMPSKPYHTNKILSLIALFPAGFVFPSLQELTIELHVDVSSLFFHRHAQNLQSLGYPSNHKSFFEDILPFQACSRLSTLIIHLNSDSLEYPVLPANVHRIVVLQPFLPVWRTVEHLAQHLKVCLNRICTIPENHVRQVLCEDRGNLGSFYIDAQTDLFAAARISFSTFSFGTYVRDATPDVNSRSPM